MSSENEMPFEKHDHHHCHGRRHFIKIPFIIAAILIVKSGLVFLLWNNLIPDLFHGPQVTYLQALGLVVLAKLLVGFHGRPGGFGGRGHHVWRERWWQNLSPEEREKFWEKLKQRKER
jgi:hypothetical protein